MNIAQLESLIVLKCAKTCRDGGLNDLKLTTFTRSLKVAAQRSLTICDRVEFIHDFNADWRSQGSKRGYDNVNTEPRPLGSG